MNIAVFCSQYDVAEKYTNAAKTLAELIARGGHTLVWGGADEGIMGLIADTVKHGGGKIIGVIREKIQHKAKKDADEMHVVANSFDMNLGIIERSDFVTVLAGGIGTLNEVTEIIRMNKNGDGAKPVIFVNTDGFYEGMKTQLKRMGDEGFIRPDVVAAVRFVDTPEEAMHTVEHYGN